MASYLNSVLGGYQGLGSVIGTQANLGNEPSLESRGSTTRWAALQDPGR